MTAVDGQRRSTGDAGETHVAPFCAAGETPTWVLACQPNDQSSNVTADRRSTWPSGVGPTLRHQAPVPVQQGGRFHQKRRPPDAWQQSARSRQEESINRPKRGPPDLPAEHRQLVAEHDDLQLPELSGAKQKTDQLQDAAEQDIAH
jgi:hypothetical protein